MNQSQTFVLESPCVPTKKRNLIARSPDTLQKQLSKKGKNARRAANAFLADQANLNLEALGKPELITKINSCITLLREQCEISDSTEL
jgi:hypothetical protein